MDFLKYLADLSTFCGALYIVQLRIVLAFLFFDEQGAMSEMTPTPVSGMLLNDVCWLLRLCSISDR
jgi:hypothetical protein